MSKTPEIEFKNLLTEKEYQTLLNLYQVKESDFFVQENIYYDTVDKTLENSHAALRIRLFADKAEQTLKTPFKTYLMETTDALQLEEARQLIKKEQIKKEGAVNETLSKMAISLSDLRIIGSLKTTRFEKELSHGLLVLDKSEYFGTVDYELEYEAQEELAGSHFFAHFLNQHHIPRRETKNKILRMKEAHPNE